MSAVSEVDVEDATVLRREIESLRARLQEAEEVCRALKSGEVDAVVVGEPQIRDRVLLMSDAYLRYREVVEDMVQGAVTISSDGEIAFANHAFADLLEVPLIDVTGTPLGRWVSPEDRHLVAGLALPEPGQPAIELLLNGARPRRASAAVVSASDSFVTLLFTDLSSAEQDAEAVATVEAIRHGAVDAFVIGEQEVQMLEGAQAPYRETVDRMRQGAVTVDAGGAIVFLNETFVSMARMPRGQMLGRPLTEYLELADVPKALAMLDGGDDLQAELRLRTGNGQSLPVQASMTVLDGHRLFLFQDISRQKRYQATEAQTRKFLGMLAQEFAEIVAPIQKAAARIGKSGAEREACEAAAEIERHADRLLGIVQDLRRVNPRD